MVSKIVGDLRLIVSGLALLGAQTASAGLMLTVDALQDFQFSEMKVEYNPRYHSLGVIGGNRYSVAGNRSSGTAQTTVGNLHLTATVTNEGSLNGAFEVKGKLNSTDPTPVLLAGSLEQIQVDRGDGYFVFLTQGNTVDVDFADKYLDSGVQVSFRVTKPGGTGLMDAFGARAAIGALDQSSPRDATPSIPVPGTIALLLIAGLPLAAARRRRRR